MNCLQLLLVLLLISTIAALHGDGRVPQRRGRNIRTMSNLLNFQTRDCPSSCPAVCPNQNECCDGDVCNYSNTLNKYFCIGCGSGGGE
uniref:Conotoxin QcMNCL-XIII0.1 n=1 Tax=Conus quercinus TaxID=101313 RepID=CXDA_CONQU|nr:RecName: Full=Conotoxin QcMNCL-XIII0.1; Flags: Precursor [Conus quercinus]